MAPGLDTPKFEEHDAEGRRGAPCAGIGASPLAEDLQGWLDVGPAFALPL